MLIKSTYKLVWTECDDKSFPTQEAETGSSRKARAVQWDIISKLNIQINTIIKLEWGYGTVMKYA